MPMGPKNGIDEARPVVNLLVTDPSADERVQPICLGLEEEEIPWHCQPIADKRDLTALAKQAADGSKLGVGLAVDEDGIVLHHRDLPPGKPLLTLTEKELNAAQLRQLGANAARLVKGNPLLLDGPEEAAPTTVAAKTAPETPRPEAVDPDRVADLVSGALAALGLGWQDKDTR